MTGYTGRVRSFDRNGKRLWGSFGVPTTQTNAKLAIAPGANNTSTITWTGGGVLEESDAVTGPWTAVGGSPTSPATVNNAAMKKFYRVRQ